MAWPLGGARTDAGVEGGHRPGVPAECPLPETRPGAVEGTYVLVLPTCDTSTPLLLLGTISPQDTLGLLSQASLVADR